MYKTPLSYFIEGNTVWLRYRYLKISVEEDRAHDLEPGKWQMDFGTPLNGDAIPFGFILVRKVPVDHMALSRVFCLAWSPHWSWDVNMFWSSILFHLWVSILPVPYWFCYYGSVIHTDIWNDNLSSIVLLLRIALVILGLLWFHEKFRNIFFSISVNNDVGILIGSALNL